MSVDHVPGVQWIRETGPGDAVFDGLLLAGPLVIIVLAFLGRTLLTTGLVGGYLGVFVAYTAFKWLT